MVIIENDVISTPLGRRPILRCLQGAPCGKCIFLHYLVALGKEKKSQTKKEIEFKFAYNFQINLFKRLQAVNSFVTGDRNLPRIGTGDMAKHVTIILSSGRYDGDGQVSVSGTSEAGFEGDRTW